MVEIREPVYVKPHPAPRDIAFSLTLGGVLLALAYFVVLPNQRETVCVGDHIETIYVRHVDNNGNVDFLPKQITVCDIRKYKGEP